MALRNIPSIDELLGKKWIREKIKHYNREFIVTSLRQVVEQTRQELRSASREVSKEELTNQILSRLQLDVEKQNQGTLRKVINGTGVVLHTNLGRAPLGQRAIEYLEAMARGYTNLEMDLESGSRGSRYRHVEELLLRLTGAEAALVVNNNAAAVLLCLSTLARGREVIVSRGQLIEIGGAFRIPEVMAQSGAHLVEVGTTNRTYLADYSAAINEETALLFSAHTSNYKIVGFTEEVKLADLVHLGQQKDIPVLHDLGSGILADLGKWGLGEEPTVQECITSGAPILTFSGDKLLGGPQAGIIIGQKKYIQKMKSNQLTRALRVDKLTIAALEGTLLEYLSGNPQEEIPVIRMLTRSQIQLREQAEDLKQLLEAGLAVKQHVKKIEVKETEDMVGGGAYPIYKLPGYCVQISLPQEHLETMAARLRLGNPALLVRKQADQLLISVRTLLPGDDALLVELLVKAIE